MSLIKKQSIKNQGGLILVILALCILFTILNTTFINGANLMNIIRQASVNIIVVMGVSIIMIAGELDLSVAGVACLTGMIVSRIMVAGVSIWAAILIGLVLGAAIGLLNGFLTTRFKLSSMIITLAVNSACTGFASLVTGGTAVYGLPKSFEFLGRGTILKIPTQVIVMAVIVTIAWVLLNKTLAGRYALAIGGDNKVSRLAGISVNKYKLAYFIISGLLAALAGMILTSRLSTGQPSLATNMNMDSITAVVLGGTAMEGGGGSIIGSLLGALLLTIITNGLTINGVDSYWQMVISAVVLVVTIVARRKKD